jgi:hypothetical protein
MPDPSNYEIVDVHECGFHQVLLVKYPGVTTFGGMKCLVVRASMKDLVKAKTLDPHFYDKKRPDGVEVVGRFPPTSSGIENAKKFARALGGGRFNEPEPRRGGPGDR